MKKVKRWTGLLALLFFASCGDITDSVKDGAAQKTFGKARVTLSVNSSFAKTIMPVNAGESDFTKIELTAKKFEKITATYEAYDFRFGCKNLAFFCCGWRSKISISGNDTRYCAA